MNFDRVGLNFLSELCLPREVGRELIVDKDLVVERLRLLLGNEEEQLGLVGGTVCCRVYFITRIDINYIIVFIQSEKISCSFSWV